MKKITAQDIPYGYVCCMQADCPVASRCLRHLAWQALRTSRTLHIVNPPYAGRSADCEFYRQAVPVCFGRGFIGMREQMIPRHYEAFKARLRRHFSRTIFYERQRGASLCSPMEMRLIRETLQSLGLPQMEFDGYVEQYEW